jgi:cell fate regulator YaaT (PSP1 superfamily)
MADIVGIRFKRSGKIYYFDPAGHELHLKDQVIVDSSQGLEMGEVALAPKQVVANELEQPLKPIVRRATPEDLARLQENIGKEKEALVECDRLIAELNLPMKLLSAEYGFDGSRVTFFFGAEERVDFRRLVKELTGRLKARVELRQVGARDEAKMVGGYGRCGQPLCCARFLNEFSPVSIKMAKEQGLPLNPMRISGICGRLLCCLCYEHEQYRDLRAKLPKTGQPVGTASGEGFVVDVNPIKETVMVELETGVRVEFPASELKILTDKPMVKLKRRD